MLPADIHFLQKSNLHIVVLYQDGKSQREHAINDFFPCKTCIVELGEPFIWLWNQHNNSSTLDDSKKKYERSMMDSFDSLN